METTHSVSSPTHLCMSDTAKRFLHWVDQDGKKHKRQVPANCYLLSPLEIADAIFLGDIRFNEQVRAGLLVKILLGIDARKAIQVITKKDRHETHT